MGGALLNLGQADPNCSKLRDEPILNSILRQLISEGTLPPGSWVDAGARFGEWACTYAQLQPLRLLHAIDPLQENVGKITQHAQALPNLRPLLGLLGSSQVASLVIPRSSFHMGQLEGVHAANGSMSLERSRRHDARYTHTLSMFTLDDLFAGPWHGERFGLAHLDCEGSELAALRGGMRVIRRDAPVLVTEAYLHSAPQLEVLALLRAEGYQSFAVTENCGLMQDCRNLLHLPRGFETRGLTLQKALEGRYLVDVHAPGALAAVAPTCCRPGAKCCPVLHELDQLEGQAMKMARHGCCTRNTVAAVLNISKKEVARRIRMAGFG